MVPGFVILGSLAILVQVLVIGGLYWYLQYRRPVTESAMRLWLRRVVTAGTVLLGLGQFLAIGAVGSLRTTAIITLRQALLVQDAGLVVALLGYLCVLGGFVAHARHSI